MYWETYIEKAIVKTYMPGNQIATEKNGTGKLGCIHGGRFATTDGPIKIPWVVFRGNDDQGIDKDLKHLTGVVLVFAVIYMTITVVLALQ